MSGFALVTVSRLHHTDGYRYHTHTLAPLDQLPTDWTRAHPTLMHILKTVLTGDTPAGTYRAMIVAIHNDNTAGPAPAATSISVSDWWPELFTVEVCAVHTSTGSEVDA